MTDRRRVSLIVLVLVLVLIAAVIIAGCQSPPTDPSVAGNTEVMRGLRVQNDAAVGGALTVTGAGDIGGSLNFGANDLYPVGNTADGKKLLIGVTGGVVQKATVVPTVSYISTVTAFGCEPQSAAFAGAWDCRVQLGAANQLTMTLYEVDATPVPTAAYAKIQYWIVGN